LYTWLCTLSLLIRCALTVDADVKKSNLKGIRATIILKPTQPVIT